MQYPSSIKLRHADCQVVRRRGRVVVICKSDRRFNQTQRGPAKRK